MLPAQPSCCRAVKRRLQAPSDAIWITDVTLAWAFNRLSLISRPSRRNGTSVPGPLECRRRAGKRRMTHYAEVSRPPPTDFGALWGLGRKPDDHTKWNWEAPTAAPTPQSLDASPMLPTWLTEFEAPEVMGADTDVQGQHDPKRQLQQFCNSLRQTTKHDAIKDLCDDFNRDFQRSIQLGQVSNSVLAASIRDVPNYVKQRLSEEALANTACLTFLRAVWDGISESKVLRPAEVDTDVLHWLFLRLQQLPLQQCAPLFTDVLDSINGEQKAELKQSILSLTNATFGPALGDTAFAAQTHRTPPRMKLASTTKEGLLDISFLETFVQSLGAALSTYPKTKAREHVRDLARISSSYVALSIHRHCVSVSEEIRSGSVGFDPEWNRIKAIRKSWLKLVARLPYASESLVVDACKIMEAGDPNSENVVMSHLSVSELCDILLEFWAVDGRALNIPKVQASFEAAVDKQGAKNAIVHFARALELHSKLWRKKTEDFLRVLRKIRGSSLSTYHCLKRLESAKIYLRATTLREEINSLSKGYLPHAKLLLQKYSARPIDALSLQDFPDVAVAMIHEPACNSEEVWDAMGGDKIWKEQSISQLRIALVERMAHEFARSEEVSSRIALRNVTKCYHYLCYHKVPISSKMSQLITRVGLERHILEKGDVSNDQLNWVLKIVEKAEGERKANLMEEVISRRKGWKSHILRDALKRGPID